MGDSSHPCSGSIVFVALFFLLRRRHCLREDQRQGVSVVGRRLAARFYRNAVPKPAETWELVCDSLDLDLRDQVLGEVKSAKVEVSTSLVKSDLKAEITVAGAKLVGGTYVVIK